MTTPISKNMTLVDWAMLLVLSVLWGGSFFFVELLVDVLPLFTIVTLRVALAAAALWLFILLTGQFQKLPAKVWLAFLIMGLLNNAIPFSLIVSGQQDLSSGLAAILNATTPLFTVLVAGFLLADEKITRNKFIGVCVGLLGVVLIMGFDVLYALGQNLVAQLLVLGAALSYAFAAAYGRRFKPMKVAPIMVAAGQLTGSSLIMIPFAVLFDQPFDPAAVQYHSWLALIGLALFSTAIAYILFFRILASSGATNLALVTFLIPVSAIMLGVFFLGEQIGLQHLLGMLLIGAGFTVIDGRLWQTRVVKG
ncbi:MAG: DMT family transporter [Arenicella sp.]